MKYKISYYYIKSDHVMAYPEFDHDEFVETGSKEKLDKYIISQKDEWGNNFKVSTKKSFGFDYTSSQGAVKIERLIIKRIG